MPMNRFAFVVSELLHLYAPNPLPPFPFTFGPLVAWYERWVLARKDLCSGRTKVQVKWLRFWGDVTGLIRGCCSPLRGWQ